MSSSSTNETRKYVRAIFGDEDPEELDPEIYKVLQDEENEDGSNLTAILKEIEDVVEQRQDADPFAGDFELIIYDGMDIEDRVLEHLDDLEVKYKMISGIGGCLSITIRWRRYIKG